MDSFQRLPIGNGKLYEVICPICQVRLAASASHDNLRIVERLHRCPMAFTGEHRERRRHPRHNGHERRRIGGD